MSVKTKIPRDILEGLGNYGCELRGFIQMQRDAFDQMSERWQEGDRAADVSDWLDSLEEAMDALDNMRQSMN